jgi:hypothetical protein
MAQQLCRHPGCTCAARGDGFCSDSCAGGRSSEPEGMCLCGHDECREPTKSEGFGAVVDLAPQGRFVEKHTRDW